MQNQSAATPVSQPPLWLLVGISAIAPIALNGVLPANAAIMHELNTTYGLAQLVLSVYLVAAMLSQVILGSLADRLGRRPVMIGSLAVFGVGGIVCATAPSIEVLWVGRFIQGFGSAVCIFLTRTIMRDVHPKDKAASAIGYMVTAMMIAPLFGPALFGWVTDVSSWRYMYASLAIAGFLFAGLSYRFQNETHQPSTNSNKGSIKNNIQLLKESEFLAYLLIMCGSVGIYYCFLTAAPYVVMELRGHSATVYGTWFSLVAIGYLSGNFIAGKFSEKQGTERLIVFSMIPLVAGIALFWLLRGSDHLIGLFLPMQLIALSNGMCLPNLTSAAMSIRAEIAASASGLLGTIQIASAILITVALSAALKSNDLPMFVAITLCGFAAVAGLFILLRVHTN